MAKLTLSVALQLMLGFTNVPIMLAHSMQPQEVRLAVIPYTLAGMPVTLCSVASECALEGSWLEYSITNSSQEKIAEAYVRVFIVGSGAKVIAVEEDSERLNLDPGATGQGRVRIPDPIEQNSLSVIAVSKVITDRGVWEAKPSDLDRAVRARLKKQREIQPRVHFEAHVTLTPSDRPEIFRLALTDILNDSQKAKSLGDHANIILLRDSVDFDLPPIAKVKLYSWNMDEIRKAAPEKGKIFYVTYRPLETEGSRVLARISIQDQVGKGYPGLWIRHGYTFLYICVKKDGQWTIERALGYSTC